MVTLSISTERKKNLIRQSSAGKKTSINGETKRSFNGNPHSTDGQIERAHLLENTAQVSLDFIKGQKQLDHHDPLKGNIENYIGMTQVPTGIAGPLAINGSVAKGEFYIPLATTEGALVASYSRGIKACRMSGKITSVCISEGVQRSPYFKFGDMKGMLQFVSWIQGKLEIFQIITEQHSNYAKLKNLKTNIEGNSVILIFEFTTGDAAGQNMVTICASEICKYILKETPVQPVAWFIESNYSGDKKATALSFTSVRGKKVSAEMVLPKTIVHKVLKTSPEAIVEYWQASTLGVVQSGSLGAQGHFANGLTALFLATGQDVACISEAAVGITRMELTGPGDLYISVTLPALIVGTVGGGTHLPTQQECLRLMGCLGSGKAKKFAEICAALVLAGELSIAAAMSAHHFADAHQKLGRK